MFRSTLTLALLAGSILAAPVPTPASHFGHKMGEDRKLLDWDKVVSYFYALEKSSDRIRVREYGKSSEGRPMIAGFIAAPETLKKLDRYRDIQQKLSDPRKTPLDEANRLIAEGKTIVLITCSIHATEVASTSSAVEFAYRILTEDRPKFRAILNNTILILAPSINPDGVDIVTNWYRKTLNTPYEGSQPPQLYHKYVGHDNNRDWYIFSQAESRAVVGNLQNPWRPQIVYDVHQQGPYASRMFVPPWMDPIDPNVDPIISQLSNSVGMNMAADLTSAGKKGIAVNAMYDFWTPARHYQSYHGGLRILTESASARLASPLDVKAEEIQSNALGYNPRERSWNYLEPWMSGRWTIGDIVDYQLIAFESLLYQAAIRREDFLRSFYEVHRRAVTRTDMSAFVVPKEQYDPGAAKKMVETLAFGDVEVERAKDAFMAGGTRYNAGSLVIRMNQPYSAYAKTLLERQQYPDLRLYPGGPPKRPYDVTAQTLPLLMGVKVDTIAAAFDAKTEPAKTFAFELDHPKTAGSLPASDVDSWRAVNKAWKASSPVFRDTSTGDFHLTAGAGRKPVAKPRIGLYQGFVPSMDEGWTRWLLENFGFDFSSPGNAVLQGPNLHAKFDVIVFPDQPADQITNGFGRRTMPDEYAGGLGPNGAAALKQFLADGGTIVFLNHSTGYAKSQLGLDLKSSTEGASNRDFYSPGSMLNITLDKSHPLTFGLPESIAIWSEGSPAWEPFDGARIIGKYPPSAVLASGWLLGEKLLVNRSALLEIPVGKGHVVLFGMRPQYRAQSYQTFKLLFNSFLL
jgi:Zinc carboxypeptidase